MVSVFLLRGETFHLENGSLALSMNLENMMIFAILLPK
jgi:hypothetical protein